MALPVIRFEVIDRDRLKPAEGKALTPLFLVQAPSGYGKTTMVARWVSSPQFRDTTVVWLRCLQESEGGQGLFGQLREELETEFGKEDRRDPVTQVAKRVLSDREAVERLISAIDTPTMLVLDDYHNVTSAQLDPDLAALLSLNAQISSVVISQRFFVLDGPLVTSQLSVTHIDADALSFTPKEIGELAALRDIGPDIATDFVWDMTQGWPLAVSVALDELSRGAAPKEIEAALARFADHHLEVIGITGAKRVFYVVVLCENISVEMLTGTAGVGPEQNADALRALEEQGLVKRVWFASGARYRCHPGFVGFFRRPALREIGRDAAIRLQRVHALNLSLDDPDAAITQLLELSEYDAAARLLRTNFLTAMEPSTRFLEAVQRVPLAEIKDHPVLNAAMLLRSMADPLTPPAMLDRIQAQLRESAIKEIVSGSNENMVVSLAVLVVAERLRGAGEESLRLARDLERRILGIEDGSLAPMRQTMSFIHAVIGFAGIVNGDLQLAERAFQSVLQSADECDNDSERVRARSGLALIAMLSGDFALGRERLRDAEYLVRATGENGPQLSWLNREAVRALLAVEDLDAVAFDRAFSSAEPLLDRAEVAPIFVYAEAQIVRGLKDPYEALEVLRRRIPQINAAFRSVPYLRAELGALRVNLTVCVGGYEGASDLLAKLPRAHPAVRVAAARLRLFKGELVEARDLAEAVLESGPPRRLAVEASLIAAVAAWELRAEDEAIAMLGPAIEATRSFGAVGLLSGTPYDATRALVIAAYERSVKDQSEENQSGYASLVSALESLPMSLRCMRFEPLSRAELRTLRVLGTGLTTAQIAEQLFVSQNTVKFHLRGVYRKLGVSNRTEALGRAEDMGLLDDSAESE